MKHFLPIENFNKLAFTFILLLASTICLFGAASGGITGTVVEASTNVPLPGANVSLKGTSIGTMSNLEGKFRIQNVPEGKYTLQISFIGYVTQLIEVEILGGKEITQNVNLASDALNIEEVVVSAQLRGQRSAINQQLNSDALVSVVSSDKIKELPDVNAAEAIGRLPGVSLNRVGGEASKVVLRGLSPSLTSVTINGVKMPSTSATDRSVDLSIISPELLSNIQVFKSPTADMDGDAIGGIINLGVSKAPQAPRAVVRMYGGYNGLDKDLSNYRGSTELSKRFFNKKLGVIVRGNYENTNRSSENISVGWDDDDSTQFLADNLNLVDITRINKRIGGDLQLDYDYKTGSIVAQSFYSQKHTDTKTVNNSIENAGSVTMEPNHSKNLTSTWQTMLSGKQILPFMEINWLASQSKTTGDNYYDVRLQLIQASGVEQTAAPLTPQELADKRNFNYESAWIHRYYFEPALMTQTNQTLGIDFKSDYNVGSWLSGFLKFGGKYRVDVRDRDIDYQIQNWYYLQPQARDAAAALWPYEMDRGGLSGDMIMLSNFYDQETGMDIHDKEYLVYPNIDMNLLDKWHETQKSTIVNQNDQEYLKYSVNEKVSAAYIMTKISLGKWLTMIPGVRYEYSDNSYTGVVSSLDFNGSFGSKWDTTSYQKYGEVLPSLHVKIKPLQWFDVRLSAVRTIARPNYNMVTPRARLDVTNQRIYRGNPNLLHAIAWNYDASVSFFSNKFGLLTLGAFQKDFDNYFTKAERTMSQEEALLLGYPAGVYEVKEDYANFDNSKVYGFEIDLQANFSYLPKPLNGLVFNFNVTRLWSQTYAPLYHKITKYNAALRRNVVDFDKSYWEDMETRLPDQVEWISNTSVGYDYKIFSARFSMIYQSRYLNAFSSVAELATVKFTQKYTDSFLRFDVSFSAKITKQISILANLANINSESEKSYVYLPKYLSNENWYGSTIDLGVQYKF